MHVLGAEKKNLIRGADGPPKWRPRWMGILSITWLLRCPWGRLGSVLYTCNCLRRVRRRFLGGFLVETGPQQTPLSGTMILAVVCSGQGSRSRLDESPSTGACGFRRLPTPDLPREASPGADLPPKKVNNLGPMAPSPSKRNYPRAPSSRRSGLVGPHTTPPIVNYKYMTSTL